MGFVDLQPSISLTEAGKALVYGKRPQEIFLRQLLKYQLPSPYHVENGDTSGSFCVRPYLEILRLVRTLEYLTFDEIKIFALQLTDYHNFDTIKNMILAFRKKKEEYREIKPYYTTRFKNIHILSLNDIPSVWTEEVCFRNGYSSTSPSFIVTVRLCIGRGRPEWGAEPDKEYYVLKIMDIRKSDK